MSLTIRTTGRIAFEVTNAAAFIVSRFRSLARVPLSGEECEAAALPQGSSVPAVTALRVAGQPLRRLRLSVNRADSCVRLELLGYWGEVYWQRGSRPAWRGAAAA